MDQPTATLIAATIAAVASFISLIHKEGSERSAEHREIVRERLRPLIEELGDSIHKIVACWVMAIKDDDRNNLAYWETKQDEAKQSLRSIRYRTRYQLWGLDDGLKALLSLPEVHFEDRASLEHLIVPITKLRIALDVSIRNCYQHGRMPSLFERLRVHRNVSKIERLYSGLYQAMEQEESGVAPATKNAVLYPKFYATIVERSNGDLVARTDEGEDIVLPVDGRTGSGSRSDAQPGVRIMLYKRNHENFYRYRFAGNQAVHKD